MTSQPKKLTSDQERRALCDMIVTHAAEMMVKEANAPVEMVVDRFITYLTAQTVSTFGRDEAANMLKFAAGRVESGAFDHLIPTKTVN